MEGWVQVEYYWNVSKIRVPVLVYDIRLYADPRRNLGYKQCFCITPFVPRFSTWCLLFLIMMDLPFHGRSSSCLVGSACKYVTPSRTLFPSDVTEDKMGRDRSYITVRTLHPHIVLGRAPGVSAAASAVCYTHRAPLSGIYWGRDRRSVCCVIGTRRITTGKRMT